MGHERDRKMEKVGRIHLSSSPIKSDPGQPVSLLGIWVIKETERKVGEIDVSTGYQSWLLTSTWSNV